MNNKPENTKTATELQPQKTETAMNAPPTPFGFMRRFAEEMEDLFGEFGGLRFPRFFDGEPALFSQETLVADWAPKVEVKQHNGKFTVRAELPGMTKDNVNVEVTDHLLTISGERHEETEKDEDGFYRSEMSYGSFYRQIPLPEGAKTDQAAAHYSDGVLEIVMEMPKAKTKGARKLEIRHGGKAAATAKSA